MGSFLLKLALGGFGWLKQALGALLDMIRRYPLAAALIASLCLSLWLWRGKEHAEGERDKARAETAQVIAAGKEALARQIALNQATKAKYEAAAKEADHDYRIALADAMSRTDRFIRAGGLRKAGGSGASVANAPAEGEAAGVYQGMPADAIMVSADDVRICTANTVRLQAVREWGLELLKAGVAE